ncbi:unnamed protein product [Spirodela intermedia]|uniref:rhamnogalacturonan endolyase n=1 Tax=Spirodela intermedia TaxID=51605 RepID=A0A7I8JWT0_SPIIN|nr:unnamed protein product [Spirodela intermedia]
MASPAGVSMKVKGRHVVLDNGIVRVTLTNPGGMITGISFNGLNNLMEVLNDESDRGYWSTNWSEPGGSGHFDRIQGTDFRVIVENEEQVELSFSRSWNPSLRGTTVIPLSIDRRIVMFRGLSGFYNYAIFELAEDWPDFDLAEARAVFKLRKDKFHYMAMADNRQRIMPMPEDRLPPRGRALAYPEAVRLDDPIDSDLRGEVDDKYQYSCENKDNRVHGWICADPQTGFWQITPSNEFRTGGPLKQDLTSHVGPINLAMFVSTHYAGGDLELKFREGELWKKVFGPVFIYLNSTPRRGTDPLYLWEDAKSQAQVEEESWPYSFPASEDFHKREERGSVGGRLLVRDSFLDDVDVAANSAHIGLAPPGEAGSWQRESKGYQFWARTGIDGYFTIGDVRAGEYGLYAWVPGVLGDFKLAETVTITARGHVEVGDVVFEPPRDGPTLWEIGVPDRSAAEFSVPDPNPSYVNKLYAGHPDRFRQYGLWERYAELYPEGDLVYRVGASDYTKDWFYAHVTRKTGDGYKSTTWQIKFTMDRGAAQPGGGGPYKLRIALASAKSAELQVRVNDPEASPPHFTTGVIGGDNSIARHGIHGLYWLFNVNVEREWLVEGENTVFLTQARASSPFQGLMYDYLRLEAPSSPSPSPSPSL